MIAAQQTRPAGADGNAARHRIGGGLPQFGGFGETKIVVRREIYSGTAAKRTQPAAIRQFTQVSFESIMHRPSPFGRPPWGRLALGLSGPLVNPKMGQQRRYRVSQSHGAVSS
jgi:hypothetical protein